MINSNNPGMGPRQKPVMLDAGMPIEHYLRLILYRKWIILGVFVLVTCGTVFYSQRLPNVYTSQTVILVDPQKVPESYVKSTVTGDIRNRLGTLSQQILSATRLQKIIDQLNLYPGERKNGVPREEVIGEMRSDISTTINNDFGGSQDLQAFTITYSGRDPRLVAQVTNQLAGLFIDENWKAREQQATGTTEFLENQLQETRRNLEVQENKIKDFRLRHVGEMPEQETADLQIMGQLQAQLQLEGEALSRAESQKSMLESMATQSAPVIDVDPAATKTSSEQKTAHSATAPANVLASDRASLAALLVRYGDSHPAVLRLKNKIEEEEAKIGSASQSVANHTPAAAAAPSSAPAASETTATAAGNAPKPGAVLAVNHFNPVLQSQIKGLDAEIAKHKEEQQRLAKLVAGYRAKLDAIPVREQEIAELTRDHKMNETHYSQLLEKQLSAETATQLEIRQKGEKFVVLDLAVPAEKPSGPKRTLINAAGALAGLVLGLVLAIGTELLGTSITAPQDVTAATGLKVLEVIPIIQTQSDRVASRRKLVWIFASAAFAALAIGAVLFLKYRGQM